MASTPFPLRSLSLPNHHLCFAGVLFLGSKSGSHCESRRNHRSSSPFPPPLPLLTANETSPLKQPGGGGEQSLCFSLIVPPWLAVQDLQEHVVPALGLSQQSPVTTSQMWADPTHCLHSNLLPSDVSLFYKSVICWRNHIFPSTFLETEGDFEKKTSSPLFSHGWFPCSYKDVIVWEIFFSRLTLQKLLTE